MRAGRLSLYCIVLLYCIVVETRHALSLQQYNTIQTKLAKYKKVKSGMMQNLLTGKIRLV